jgi:hypothetical protein
MGERGKWLLVALVVLCLGAVACATAGAAAQTTVQVDVAVQSVVQDFAATHGTVDWTQGVIEAVGTGVPPTRAGLSDAQRRLLARRAAIVDAQRNLAETINSIHLTSATTVRDLAVEEDVVRTTLDTFIKSGQIVSEKALPDGSYEVVMRLGAYGPSSVAQASLAATVAKERASRQAVPAPEPEVVTIPEAPVPVPAPEPELPAPAEPEEAPASVGSFTGLIVDCRGLSVAPAMSPKIVDSTGTEVWGTLQVDPEVAIERGIVGYYRSLENARKSPRAGANPLIIKAIGKAGRGAKFQSDAVVASEDGARILDENAKTKFLDKLNVCFVTG